MLMGTEQIHQPDTSISSGEAQSRPATGAPRSIRIVRINHRPAKKSGPELEFVFELRGDAPSAPVRDQDTAPSPTSRAGLELLAHRLMALADEKESIIPPLERIVFELEILRNVSYTAGFEASSAAARLALTKI